MIPGGMRVLLAAKPADLRRSIDGLRSYVAEGLGQDPDVERTFFVFTNSKRDRVKVLWRDRTGWCVLYKRLDEHLVPPPPSVSEGATSVVIDARLLSKILDGVPRKPSAKSVAREAKAKALELICTPISSARV